MKRYTKRERRELKRARIAIRENRRVYLHEVRRRGLCEAMQRLQWRWDNEHPKEG